LLRSACAPRLTAGKTSEAFITAWLPLVTVVKEAPPNDTNAAEAFLEAATWPIVAHVLNAAAGISSTFQMEGCSSTVHTSKCLSTLITSSTTTWRKLNDTQTLSHCGGCGSCPLDSGRSIRWRPNARWLAWRPLARRSRSWRPLARRSRSWPLVSWSLVGLWRGQVLATDARWLGLDLRRLIPILTLSNPRSPNRGARWT
jgi:hypothetical protein